MIFKCYSSLYVTGLLLVLSCSGGSKPASAENSNPSQPQADIASIPQNTDKAGQDLFLKYCMACHQTNGSGVPGMYPPLINSPIVNSGKKEDFINVLLNGLKGPIEVHGKQYNQQMPKQDFLSDESLAKIANYVSTNFQNKGPAITPEDIKKQRKTPAR